jgi:hypothetical protein
MTLPDEPYYKFLEGYMNYDRFKITRAGTETESRICELVKDADILLSDSYHSARARTAVWKIASSVCVSHKVIKSCASIMDLTERLVVIANVHYIFVLALKVFLISA